MSTIFRISWAPPRTPYHYLYHGRHTQCLIGSGCLHSAAAAVLGILPQGTAPKYCCKWAPHQLFKDSDPATCCQVSAFLHDLFNPRAATITGPEPVVSPSLSQGQTLTSPHDLFMPSQLVKPEKLYPSPVKRPAWGKTLAPLEHCFCVLNLRKPCPENFVSKMLVST